MEDAFRTYQWDDLAPPGEMPEGNIQIMKFKDSDDSVVVKTIHFSETYGRSEFLEEAGVLARCQHKFVVKFLGVIIDESEKSGSFLLEYVNGSCLKDALSKLTAIQRYSIAVDLAEVITFLHSQRVLLLNLDLDSVLVSDDHAVLTAFGELRFHERDPARRAVSAPEPSPSEATDVRDYVYLLFELLTGEGLPSAQERHSDGVDLDKLFAQVEPGRVKGVVNLLRTSLRLLCEIFDEMEHEQKEVSCFINHCEGIALLGFGRFASRDHPADAPEFYRVFGEKCLKSRKDALAFTLLEAAAAAGDPVGMRRFGELYELGQGVISDQAIAFGLYERAAKAGDVVAKKKVLECYQKGIGVPADGAMTYRCARELAGMERAFGFMKLGLCFKRGLGVEKNPEEAFVNFRKGAELGNRVSMTYCAECYRTGFGVEADPRMARRWINRAIDAGCVGARQKLGLYE